MELVAVMAVGGRKENLSTADSIDHSTLPPVANGRLPLPLPVAPLEPSYSGTGWYVLRFVLPNARHAASRTEHGSAANRVATRPRAALA